MQLNLEQQKNDRVILRLSIQKGSILSLIIVINSYSVHLKEPLYNNRS